MTLAPCPNCGAVVPDTDGPTHPYMISSPGCWASFSALQADEYSRFGYPPGHGLAVDAFAASHGGDGSERRDRQSVAIHLLALRAVLVLDEPPERRMAMLRRLTETKRDWPKLARPSGNPALNHLHAVGATDADAYSARVREWASAVWEFWEPERVAIEKLAG